MALRAENSPSYGFDALATLKARNVEAIAFWCVRDARRCVNRHTMRIDDAIARYGPGTSLVMLARRARCRQCDALGCHVQPDAPPYHDARLMATIEARGGYWLQSANHLAPRLLKPIGSGETTMREFEDGFYWVRVSSDLDPEIAMHDHGAWRLFGAPERAYEGEFYRIGRQVKLHPDAFD